MDYHWEKSDCWTDVKCALCRVIGKLGVKQLFRRKWNSKKGEKSNDDDCIVTLCEECFIRTR